jgi:lipopolysaccharide/colanic/teichoic acid biosynthesis glycosyltransferase
MAKRVLDIVVSAVLLFVTMPVLLALAVAIRLDSPGPVLFRQPRVGKDGRVFEILKLRSMVEGAASSGSYSTIVGDPRITRLGRFIRRTSLDELPQLLNVLRGDMSLVGPRPDTPMQEANYAPADWARRISVKPGITGLAQARLRSAASPAQRLALDLEYVGKPTFPHDLAILWETARTLLLRKAI